MSWDQLYYIETLDQFLIRFLNIDAHKLVTEEIARRLAEHNLSIIKTEDINEIEDMYMPPGPLKQVTLSSGQVFVHKLTESELGDDWGYEYWRLMPENEEVITKKIYHDVYDNGPKPDNK